MRIMPGNTLPLPEHVDAQERRRGSMSSNGTQQADIHMHVTQFASWVPGRDHVQMHADSHTVRRHQENIPLTNGLAASRINMPRKSYRIPTPTFLNHAEIQISVSAPQGFGCRAYRRGEAPTPSPPMKRITESRAVLRLGDTPQTSPERHTKTSLPLTIRLRCILGQPRNTSHCTGPPCRGG